MTISSARCSSGVFSGATSFDFAAEASFLVARTRDGRIAHFPASLNTHKDGILAHSVAPAEIDEHLLTSGMEAVQTLAEAMELVGLLALETFVTKNGELLFNEIAPRPHNSFHWTIEGCATSQFTHRAMSGRHASWHDTELRMLEDGQFTWQGRA